MILDRLGLSGGKLVCQKERGWIYLYGGILLALTTLPYLKGYSVQGEEWRFTGFVFGVEDGNSYIAKMLSGAYGAWLFRTPYTAYPQAGALAFLPYILLGKLSAPPGQHEQLVALFHLFRILGGLCAVVASYEFISIFISDIGLRRWGTVIATAGAGLGWVVTLSGANTLLGTLPLDYYSPESFGFLGIYGLPHLAMARAFLLWGLGAFALLSARVSEENRMKYWFPGVFLLLLGFMQPLTVAVSWLTLTVYTILSAIMYAVNTGSPAGLFHRGLRRQLRMLVYTGIVSAPIVLITIGTFYFDPFLKTWTAQNIIRSPHPVHYALAYGLLVPFVIPAIIKVVTSPSSERQVHPGLLLISCVSLFPFLAYAPYNLQRRLPEGVWVALIALALIGVYRLDPKSPLMRLWKVTRYLVFPSTFVLFSGGLLASSQASIPLFRPSDEVEMYSDLSSEVTPGAVVLCAFESGNALPSWVPVRVLIGHGPESANLEVLRPRVQAFYQEETGDQERIRFLQEFDVAYVLWGPDERELGTWNPSSANYLQPRGEYGKFSYFKVVFNDSDP